MKISVVIGALNEEKYLGKTLKSVNEQNTSHEFEVIVGDGYSEDKTVAIAKKLGAKVVKEKRRSAAWERQAGAKIASGDVLVFTDADAIVPRTWLERIASEFLRDKSLAMVYGPVYFSDSSGFEQQLSKIVMDIFVSVCALIGLHNPTGSNIAIRRNVFEKIGGFSTNLVTAEDLDLGKRAGKFGTLKYSRDIVIEVSARRVKKWGYLKFVVFHLVNMVKFHIFGAAAKKYDPVR